MCRLGVAGPQPRIRLGGQQVDQIGTGQCQSGVADRPAGAGQMTCRVRVREPRLVGCCGPPCPGERRLSTGYGRRCGEMPGQLSREHCGPPSMPADQRLSHSPVQIQPLSPSQGGLDRLAVQVVAESHTLRGRAAHVDIG